MSPRVGSRKETDAISDESPIQLLLGTNAAASLISSGCKKLQNKRLTKRILSPAAVRLRIPKAYSVSKQLYSRLRTKGNDQCVSFLSRTTAHEYYHRDPCLNWVPRTANQDEPDHRLQRTLISPWATPEPSTHL